MQAAGRVCKLRADATQRLAVASAEVEGGHSPGVLAAAAAVEKEEEAVGNRERTSTHKVMKFKVLKASVRAYQRNLNTHSSYKDFRGARAELRDKGKKLDSIITDIFLVLSKHHIKIGNCGSADLKEQREKHSKMQLF